MSAVRLRPDVHVGVDFNDRTPFGSPVGRQPETSIRALFDAVYKHVDRHGFGDLVREGPALLRGVVDGEQFREVCAPTTEGRGAWSVHPDVLFPNVEHAPPSRLHLYRTDEGATFDLEVSMDEWPAVHRLIAALSGDGLDDDTILEAGVARLRQTLDGRGLLEAASIDPDVRVSAKEVDLTYLGHNTVVVRSGTSSVVIDPMLFATKASHPRGYQPLQLRDIGRINAVLITHSHPDHFAPGSLLQFPPETRIIVPRVDQETLLAVAMERRLRELGFAYITVLDWWQSTMVGDIEIYALPFYGEQPTDNDVLHPAIRNHGNTYMVRTPTFSAAFLADSGKDIQGTARQVAARARAALGSVDVVFCGYRGWLTYPIQLLFTSVAKYILFVPPWQWTVRQRIMMTADEAVDVAEEWGAAVMVPYADGGAPWYWDIGLGPRLDEEAQEATGFDPFPERAIWAAANRTEMPDGMLGSSVEVMLLRPGDSVSDIPSRRNIVRIDGHSWPYDERPVAGATVTTMSTSATRGTKVSEVAVKAASRKAEASKVTDLSKRPERLTGAFVEQPFHAYAARREALLTRREWYREPSFIRASSIRADDLDDAMQDIKSDMAKDGLVKLQLDRGVSNEEFVAFGRAFGTVMVHETTKRLQEYVEDRVVLNLIQEHPQTGEYDLALVAENFLNLHSEVCTRPLNKQPRYIALLCVEPPIPDAGGQTVFVSMDSVSSKLEDHQHALLGSTNFRDFPDSPPVFSRREGRPVFSFRDFGNGKDILYWRYAGKDRAVDASDVREAILALLEGMHDPDITFGIDWSRNALIAFDNWRFFHGRTQIRPADGAPRRHFKNLKIN
jgi:L-ascorbate metabolism protein UlaG (beta-lactamase superfamily)/alpha-ketoglutarate-dependent taurine dioxygenase